MNEQNEGLLHGGPSPNKDTTDDARSMAIMNLQAMLDIDDLDKVITLLEQNDWDEGQATNAYYAQQTANGMGGGEEQQNDINPFMNEEAKDEHGYRAPIQQQEDQLIDDSPFANLFTRPYTAPARNTMIDNSVPMGSSIHGQNQERRPSSARIVPRIREVKPSDYTFQIDTPYDEGEASRPDNYRQIHQEQPRRSWAQSIWSIFSSGWAAIRWIITLGGSIAPVNTTQLEFGCGEAIINDDRLLASLNIDQDQVFFKTAGKARKYKKPLLLLVVGNPDDTQQVDFVIKSIVEANEMTREILEQRFELFIVSQEELETNLNDSERYFRINTQEDINIFILFIKPEQKISVMSRILQREIEDPNRFTEILNEYAGLFDIMAEEDSGYRQLQILQDAGILPVTAGQNSNNIGGRNTRANTISNEMMEKIMQEDAEIAAQQNQPNRPAEEIIQPRAEQNEKVEEKPKVEEYIEVPEIKPKVQRREISLPSEPETSNADSLELIFRMPLSGERIRRRFLKDDTIQTIYDFIDTLQDQEKCQFEGIDGYTDKYQVMQTRPRVIYNEKDKSLESVGFHPRGAMLQIQELEEESD